MHSASSILANTAWEKHHSFICYTRTLKKQQLPTNETTMTSRCFLDLFHKQLMNAQLKSCENFPSNCYSNDPIRSQFCTCHDSLAVMTCAKLQPNWVIVFRLMAIFMFTSFELWAHKPFINGSLFLIYLQILHAWTPLTHLVLKY